MNKFFTSESVTEGHPDKVCDYIADSILDEIIAQDKTAHTAIEVCAMTDRLVVFGEVTTIASFDAEAIARNAIKKIGYDDPTIGFDYKTCTINVYLNTQSPDIAQGVNSAADYDGTDEADKVGAGDQGMMFGFASSETKELMPLAITLAHKLTAALSEKRKSGELKFLRPDGKAQVTVEYRDNLPPRIDTVVLSTQHDTEIETAELRKLVKEKLIDKVISQGMCDTNTKYYINPTGRFVVGGPNGDSGLTGRKIIVDTYGGYCAHGGGSFSGKDPTKVDRSATYMARYVCKNIVASGMAEKCEIQIAYAIGRAKPVSVTINSYGTGKVSDELLAEGVSKVFDLRPSSIISTLKLTKPVYSRTTNYGHFGREDFAWEMCDKAIEFKSLFN